MLSAKSSASGKMRMLVLEIHAFASPTSGLLEAVLALGPGCPHKMAASQPPLSEYRGKLVHKLELTFLVGLQLHQTLDILRVLYVELENQHRRLQP
ncbi:unnamed protein product [Schistocephalus solidus]|uniref:Secreted protein n=1 Tax=Schistocephalus solidus TaxID=70667 RepID=A0A183TNM5_SCHSO|nr:unnamed protein product [Schistocephalus solidus]